MREIKVIADHMDDTLGEADTYYKDYYIYKDSCPRLSSMALYMAKEHLDLYMKWHTVAVELIGEYRKSGKAIPDGMEDRYNERHGELKEEYDRIAWLISQAK